MCIESAGCRVFTGGLPVTTCPYLISWRLSNSGELKMSMLTITRALAVSAAICGLAARAAPPASSPTLKGKLERIKVHGTSLEGNLEGDSPDRDVSIYLPPSYTTHPDRRYPVLYILHGFTDSDDHWFGLVQHFVNVPVAMEAALAK